MSAFFASPPLEVGFKWKPKRQLFIFVLALRAPLDPLGLPPQAFPSFFGRGWGAVRLLLLGCWSVLLGCCTGCLGCWAVAGGGLLFEDTAKHCPFSVQVVDFAAAPAGGVAHDGGHLRRCPRLRRLERARRERRINPYLLRICPRCSRTYVPKKGSL